MASFPQSAPTTRTHNERRAAGPIAPATGALRIPEWRIAKGVCASDKNLKLFFTF